MNTIAQPTPPLTSAAIIQNIVRVAHPKAILIGLESSQTFLMLCMQILWWGIGLTLVYDFCESILHLPHMIALIAYAACMISSTWFCLRTMLVISIITLPSFIGLFYFMCFTTWSGDGFLTNWSQLLEARSLEYIGWFLMVLGSFVNATLDTTHKEINWIKWLCYSSMMLGGILMLIAACDLMQQVDLSKKILITTQQASYFLWIFGLGGAKRNFTEKPNKKLSIKLPSRIWLLIAGTLLIMLYDWFFLNTSSLWQYFIVLLPPFSLMLINSLVNFDIAEA